MLSQRAPLPSGSVRIELDDPDEDDLVAERVVLVRRLELIFDGPSAASDQVIPIATAVDTSRWAHGAVVVLLHAKSAWSADARMIVSVDAVELDPDEPDVVFRGPKLGAVAFKNDPVAPALVVDAFLPSAWAQVRVTWAQATELPGPQTAVLSVWLLGRTGQPLDMRRELATAGGA